MKHPQLRRENNRFNGRLRHYHRSGPPSQPTCGKWVEGKNKSSLSPAQCLKIGVIILSLVVLGGVIAGLIVERR